MKKLVIVWIAVFLIISFCACSNNTAVKESASVSDVFDDVKGSDEPDTDLLVDFEPFECKGDYYYFDNIEVQNQNGIKFKEVPSKNNPHFNSDKLVYCIHNEEKILIQSDTPDVYFNIWAYIDDALYFTANEKLYRMGFDYDEFGDIANSRISLVADGYWEPVKAENNTLTLRSGNFAYSLLDTQTGKLDSVKYNCIVTDEYDNLKGLITKDKAIDIALKEIKDLKYYDDIATDMTDERVSVFAVDYNYPPELVYKPDYVYGISDWTYELYPEYAWHIQLKGEYRIDVYVDARSGNVANVAVEFLD